MKPVNILTIAALIVVAVAVTGGMWWVRGEALRTYGTSSAQTEWNEWRTDAIKAAKEGGPVVRQAPKSAEPPALVLMRDHFAACLGGALTAALGVSATFIVMLRGVLATPSRPLGD